MHHLTKTMPVAEITGLQSTDIQATTAVFCRAHALHYLLVPQAFVLSGSSATPSVLLAYINRITRFHRTFFIQVCFCIFTTFHHLPPRPPFFPLPFPVNPLAP